jgi:hypothetical protein
MPQGLRLQARSSTNTTDWPYNRWRLLQPHHRAVPERLRRRLFLRGPPQRVVKKRLDGATRAVSGFATGLSGLDDLKVGDDGSLYYLSRGDGMGSVGKTKLHRHLVTAIEKCRLSKALVVRTGQLRGSHNARRCYERSARPGKGPHRRGKPFPVSDLPSSTAATILWRRSPLMAPPGARARILCPPGPRRYALVSSRA